MAVFEAVLEQAVFPVYAQKVNFELAASCSRVPGYTQGKECIIKLQEMEIEQISVCVCVCVCAHLHKMGLI